MTGRRRLTGALWRYRLTTGYLCLMTTMIFFAQVLGWRF